MTLLPTTFRNRLALLCGGLGLLVGLPVYLYINHVYLNQLLDERGHGLRDLAASVAAVMSENLNERRREIELLARTPLYRRAHLDSPDFRPSLERLQGSYPSYSWIGIADTAGTVRAATGGLLVGQNVAQRPWFAGGSRATFIGDLHDAVLLSKLLKTEADEGPMRFIDFAAPVFGDDGRLRGVIAAHAHWRWAGEVLSVLQPSNAAQMGLEFMIATRDGVIIHPEGAHPARLPAGHGVEHGHYIDRWGGDRDYLTAVMPVREVAPTSALGWQVVVRQPLDTVVADVRALRHVVLVSGLMAVAALFVLAWWAASQFSRPLERLTRMARRIERGDEKVAVTVDSSTRELRYLGDAVRGMAETLIHRREAIEANNRELEGRVEQRTAELARLNEELRDQARRDALTGLPNRLAANERLREEFVRMKRSGLPYAVLVLDIDHFKRINDGHGHPVGDAVLRHVAGVLRAALRETDFVARFGGEEFLVILPATPSGDARQVGEKVRRSIEAATVEPVGTVTISTGLSMADVGQEDEDIAVREADALLYRAKAGGRNRVVAADLAS